MQRSGTRKSECQPTSFFSKAFVKREDSSTTPHRNPTRSYDTHFQTSPFVWRATARLLFVLSIVARLCIVYRNPNLRNGIAFRSATPFLLEPFTYDRKTTHFPTRCSFPESQSYYNKNTVHSQIRVLVPAAIYYHCYLYRRERGKASSPANTQMIMIHEHLLLI